MPYIGDSKPQSARESADRDQRLGFSEQASEGDFLYVLQHLVRCDHVETGILDFAARYLGKVVRTFRHTSGHVPVFLACVVCEDSHKLVEFPAYDRSCISVTSCFSRRTYRRVLAG